ncbi:hypothetical protein BABINDRAFT_161683 [Babjeviella inositovora NRRL Y-12698]|uniref:Uncharacterized protein n=1 Tax=Babjeviella inositovora NRRL Y-12698 TaxID=984486 RepID=A0A1E3QQT6_9ASCO|nr:uncharacterized protein BABINDRAFT_161683 [Babjeviella inositovora NRRL Y-12698]ODQ80041.1 hypothetical protein BABINDRAFT_161683 [Babjeviella inositovora NRRL Y-12698]
MSLPNRRFFLNSSASTTHSSMPEEIPTSTKIQNMNFVGKSHYYHIPHSSKYEVDSTRIE